MRPELEIMIEEQRKYMPGGVDRVEFLNFKYEINYNKLVILKLTGLSINNCDTYDVAGENIVDGPFTIYFNDDIDLDDTRYQREADYNADSLELNIDGHRVYVKDYYDIQLFASDFHAKPEQVLDSIMKTFIAKQKDRNYR